MLEEKITLEYKEKGESVVLPVGVYTFELLNITSENKVTWKSRLLPIAEQVYEKTLTFELAVLNPDTEADHWRAYTRYINFIPTYFYQGDKGKNKLWKIIEAFEGNIDVTQQRDTEFLNSLIGKQFDGVVEHTVKGEKTYANVVNYLQTKTKLEPLTDAEKKEIQDKKDEWEKEKASKATVNTPVGTTDIKVEDLSF